LDHARERPPRVLLPEEEVDRFGVAHLGERVHAHVPTLERGARSALSSDPAMAVTFAFYVGGFKNATDRLRGAGDDWERGFVALYETLAWCGSIRDWLHKHQRSVKDE